MLHYYYTMTSLHIVLELKFVPYLTLPLHVWQSLLHDTQQEPVFCFLIHLHHVTDFPHLWQVLLKQSGVMESPQFSMLSSLRGEFKSEDFIQPHYKEAYRLAIDHLVSGGRDSYEEFLKGERIGCFLSEDELKFIIENAEQLPPQTHIEENSGPPDNQSSSGTYWPIHSDVDTPDLDLGWPEVMHERLQTNIDLLFHPPRQNNPTIKEVIRKHIQDARQVIRTTCYNMLREIHKALLWCVQIDKDFSRTSKLAQVYCFVTLFCLTWELCLSIVCRNHLSPLKAAPQTVAAQFSESRSVC